MGPWDQDGPRVCKRPWDQGTRDEGPGARDQGPRYAKSTDSSSSSLMSTRAPLTHSIRTASRLLWDHGTMAHSLWDRPHMGPWDYGIGQGTGAWRGGSLRNPRGPALIRNRSCLGPGLGLGHAWAERCICAAPSVAMPGPPLYNKL